MKLRQSSSGATLLEMILTIALFAIVLSAVGSLLKSASQLNRRADRLSWSNQASQWLDQIELDVATAQSMNVAPGGNDTKLEVSVRQVTSPSFLPEPPPEPWDPDAPASLETRKYEIQSEKLVLTVITTSGNKKFVFGPAEALEVSRSADGDLSLKIERSQDIVTREVPPFVLDSERAPL